MGHAAQLHAHLAAGVGVARHAAGCAGPRCAIAAAVLAFGVTGCNATVEPSFDDPTPEARIGAIRNASAKGDRATVPRLVECLYSDDPAVRLAAIEALMRITGKTFDYRASAPPAMRAQAIERWKTWVREQGLHTLPAAPTQP